MLQSDTGLVSRRASSPALLASFIGSTAPGVRHVPRTGLDYVARYRQTEPTRITADSSLMATTPESVALSKDLKKRGWSFVGPTTVYAFMQAMGLVNDHIEGCWVYDEAG